MTDRLTTEARAALDGAHIPSRDIPLSPKGLSELENRTIECHHLRAENEQLRADNARLRNLLTKVAEHPDTHPLIASVIRNELGR